MATAYQFRSVTADDLPLLRGWLAMPHVVEWWGDPDEQFGLVSDDLTHPAMDQFVVSTGARPFAYLQCYRLTDWNVNFGPLPATTRGIDRASSPTPTPTMRAPFAPMKKPASCRIGWSKRPMASLC